MQNLQYTERNIRRPRHSVEHIGHWRIEEKPSRFPGQSAFFVYRDDDTGIAEEAEGPFFSAVKARLFIAARDALS